jgi:hypothetical protein
LIGLVLVGCSTNPGKNPDPVEVSGKVTSSGGKPVTDVVLNLQPVGIGGHATATVKNGEFKAAVIPGKYTYFFAEGSKAPPAAFRAIPEKYRAGAMDRQIEIKAGTVLDLKLE